MKHFFKVLLLLGLTISANSVAQKDTLVEKDYIELSELLNRFMLTDSTKALNVSRYYIQKAQDENELMREAEGIHALMGIYFNHKDAVKSERELDRLLTFIKENKLEKFRTRAYQIAGTVYLMAGKIKKAMAANQELLAIAEAANDEVLIKQAKRSIDFIASMGGDSNSFISKNKKELERLLSNPQTGKLAKDWGNKIMITEMLIADGYYKMKNGDSSAFYTRLALQKSLNRKDTCITKALYMMLGNAETLIGDYTDAKKSFDYSTKYCLPLSEFDSLILGGGYAKLAYKQKDYSVAIDKLEQAFKAFKAYEVTEVSESFMDDFYFILADSYKELGDLTNSTRYYQKHLNTTDKFNLVQDSIQRNTRARENKTFETELLQLKEEKESRTKTLIIVLFGASVLIIALLFFLLKFYKTKKADEAKFEALVAKINAATIPAEIIDTKDEELEEKASNDVSVEVTQQILDGLKKLEEKEYFLRQECNSYNVAKKINTNTSYLSKVINSHYGKNYNTYINDLRINYAIIRLKNDVFFRSFSIQAIAEEVGYKSADSFTKYFKKDTGLNPSFYIKNIKNIV